VAETGKRGSEPIRLFKSDFLESLSHVKPATVLVLWTPVTLYFLVISFWNVTSGLAAVRVVAGLLGGWVVWTLTEYLLHRFFFHYHPRTERLKRTFFLVHGVHHAQPLCKTRLVMPPVMSIPLAILFFGLFHLLIDIVIGRPALFPPVFAGFVGGYIVYDMMHYTLHHSRSKNAYVLMCRLQHMQHHGTCPTMRFGVSSPVWDYVFGTMPRAAQGKDPDAAASSPQAPVRSREAGPS
jgi:sterol desaturase/sphingolipid hydroxylase (fatty acid hydroxylase superfamily)